METDGIGGAEWETADELQGDELGELGDDSLEGDDFDEPEWEIGDELEGDYPENDDLEGENVGVVPNTDIDYPEEENVEVLEALEGEDVEEPDWEISEEDVETDEAQEADAGADDAEGTATAATNSADSAEETPKVASDATDEAEKTAAATDESAEKEGEEQTEEPLKFGELEADATYERNGFEYETDEQGRVNFICGKLELGEGVRTGEQTRVGHLGLEDDEGGHFIGTQFKGSPEGVNLFPQNENFNHSAYATMEREWADALKEGKEVEVAIQPVHVDDDHRPIGMDVYYVIDGEPTTKSFYNEAGEGKK